MKSQAKLSPSSRLQLMTDHYIRGTRNHKMTFVPSPTEAYIVESGGVDAVLTRFLEVLSRAADAKWGSRFADKETLSVPDEQRSKPRYASPKTDAVIAFIRENPKASKAEVCRRVGCSYDSIYRAQAKMAEGNGQ